MILFAIVLTNGSNTVAADTAPDSGQKTKFTSLVKTSIGLGITAHRYKLGNLPTFQSVNPEMQFHLDAFFIAPFTRTFLKTIAISTSYSRQLSVSSQIPSGESLDTNIQELLLDLAWQWNFLHRPTSPSMRIEAGWGMRDFDLAQNRSFPSLNYRFAHFAMSATIPIGTPWFACHLGGDIRPLYTSGNAVRSLGKRTSGIGWSLKGGFTGSSGTGFLYYITVEYLRMRYRFAGLDASGIPVREDYPDSASPMASNDRYLRIWIGVGYVL